MNSLPDCINLGIMKYLDFTSLLEFRTINIHSKKLILYSSAIYYNKYIDFIHEFITRLY